MKRIRPRLRPAVARLERSSIADTRPAPTPTADVEYERAAKNQYGRPRAEVTRAPKMSAIEPRLTCELMCSRTRARAVVRGASVRVTGLMPAARPARGRSGA